MLAFSAGSCQGYASPLLTLLLAPSSDLVYKAPQEAVVGCTAPRRLWRAPPSGELSGRTQRDRRGREGALLFCSCSSTGLGLHRTLSVPPDLVAFQAVMVLDLVPPRHGDTGQGPQAGIRVGSQAMRAPGGGSRRCCEHLQWEESYLA